MAFARSPSGEIVEIPDADLASASIVGYTPVTTDDVAAAQAEAARRAQFETLPQQALGAVEALGRGATLNVTDPLAVALGADPERMAGRREALGGLGTALEIGGAALPVLLSGGTGAVGQAARFAPTSLLSRGTAALGERATTALLGAAPAAGTAGVGQALARGAVQGGITELIEGTPYGVGQVITEATLGDLDVLSEEAAMTVGLGTILGGGLGAAVGAAGGGLGAALRKSQRAIDSAIDTLDKQYPEWIAGKVGADAALLRQGWDQRARLEADPAMRAEDLLEGLIPEVADVPKFVPPPVPEEAVFTKGEFTRAPLRPKPSVYQPPENVVVAGRVIPVDAEGPQFTRDVYEAMVRVQDETDVLQREVNTTLRMKEREQLLDAAGIAPEVAAQKATEAATLMDEFVRRGRADGPDSMDGGVIRQVENSRDGVLRNAFSPDEVPLALRGAVESGVDQGATVGVRESVVRTGATPRGEPIAYDVVELDELIPSHNPKTWRPRPDYPEGMQQRTYHSDKGEINKVVEAQQQFDPSLPLSNTVLPTDGPPLVTGGDRRLVLGGNGRTMMMQLAMESPDVVRAYREELVRRAGGFGLDSAQIRQMKKPVLVRTVTGLTDKSPVADLTAAVRRYNEGLTRTINEMARGVSDAKMLSPASIADLALLFDESPNRTLGQILNDQSETVIKALRRDKIITDQNVSEWLSANNNLTSLGKDRINAMLLGRVVGTPQRYALLYRDGMSNLAAKIDRVVPYLAKVEALNPSLGETGAIRRAIDLNYRVANSEGKLSLDSMAKQVGLPGMDEVADPVVVAMARRLLDGSVADVADRFRSWASRASQSTDLAGRKSLTRDESRRLLLGAAANDVPASRLAAEVTDPDAGAAASFAATVGATQTPVEAAVAGIGKAPSKSPVAVYNAIEAAIRQIDAKRQLVSRASPQGPETIKRLNDLMKDMKRLLTDEGAWGEAAVRQARINEAYSKLISEEKAYLPLIASKGERGKMVIDEDKIAKLLNRSDPEYDPQKIRNVKTLLKRYATFRDVVQETADRIGAATNRQSIDAADAEMRAAMSAEAELRKIRGEIRRTSNQNKRERRAWTAYSEEVKAADAARKVEFDAAEKARKASAEAKRAEFDADVKAQKEANAAAREAAKEAQQARKERIKAEAKAWRAGAKWNGFMDIIGAGAVGTNPLLAPLFVAYRFGKYLGSPDKMMRVMNQLEAQSRRAKAAIDTMADQFTRGNRVGAVRAAASVALSEEMVDRIVGSPESGADALAEATGDLRDFAPETAEKIEAKIITAAQYLASIRPRPVVGAMGKPLPLSAASVAEYETTKAVVEHPMDALKLASEGRLMARHVAALEAVWPQVLQQMRVSALDALAGVQAEGKTPSFRVLQQLSVLMGADMTHTIASGAANQLSMMQEPAQARATPARADRVTLAQRSQTTWESSEGG